MEKSQPPENKKQRIFRYVVLVAIAVLLLWYFWPNIITSLKIADNSFGGLSALFTGIAFVGLATTILLQLRKEKEDEIERSKNETQRREERLALKTERFETHFFHLKDTLRSLITALSDDCATPKYRPGGKLAQMLEGTRVLQRYVEILRNEYHPGDAHASPLPIHLLVQRYKENYELKQDDLGPYFRVLYHLIKYIDESCPSENKLAYAKLVRAELSSAELYLLALNGLTPNGSNFKVLIVRYHLLKHLPDSYPKATETIPSYLTKATISTSYPPEAFNDPV